MTNEQFKTILKYFDVLIDQSLATANVADALDEIQSLIKLHLEILDEED